MTVTYESRPVDCKVFIFSDDEFVTADFFAQLTIAGWGSSTYCLAPEEDLNAAMSRSDDVEDSMIVVYSLDLQLLGNKISALTNAGIEHNQILICGPSESGAYKSLASMCSGQLFAVDLKKTASGPKILREDLVQAISEKIFMRLNRLVDSEVRVARQTGALVLLKALAHNSTTDPIERATFGAIIATKYSNRLSFRRRVVRCAIFQDFLSIEERDSFLSEAALLWPMRTILDDVFLGLAALNAQQPIPRSVSSESAVVIAAECVLRQESASYDSLKHVFSAQPMELRIAISEATTYALNVYSKWRHNAAS